MQRLALGMVLSVALFPMAALANDQSLFFDIGAIHEWRHGVSKTTDGGAGPSVGGRIVDLEFGGATGLEARLGYNIAPEWSVFLSYRYAAGDIRWNANFDDAMSLPTNLSGQFASHVGLLNLGYHFVLAEKTSLVTSVGLGAAVNRLNGLTETALVDGSFVADHHDASGTDLAAQFSASFQHGFTDNISLALTGALSYSGSLSTGTYRSTPTPEDINGSSAIYGPLRSARP